MCDNNLKIPINFATKNQHNKSNIDFSDKREWQKKVRKRKRTNVLFFLNLLLTDAINSRVSHELGNFSLVISYGCISLMDNFS